MERRQFTREFKLEAVRLIKERGVGYGQASQDLGVHQSQPRTWVKAFADDPVQARTAETESLGTRRNQSDERTLALGNRIGNHAVDI